jgi:hypothetical protein|nr:MAG TPA: hypothetical protein [Caudoviricetes sp.]
MLKKEMTMITAPNNSLRKTISGIFLGDSRFAIFDLTDTELPINYGYFQKDENGFYGFGSIGKYDEWIDDTSLKTHQENLSELINQLKQYGIQIELCLKLGIDYRDVINYYKNERLKHEKRFVSLFSHMHLIHNIDYHLIHDTQKVVTQSLIITRA